MTIAIASSVLAAIIDHAAATGANEACGIVVGRADAILAAIPADNVTAEPARAFEIDPATLLEVHRTSRSSGVDVIGWYHSHPDGSDRPSATDAARAAADGKVWLIAAGGMVSAWHAGATGPVHGRFTPIALVAG